MDVDICRAIAAAVLGDATKFASRLDCRAAITASIGRNRCALAHHTITFQRDVQLGIEFPAVNWYDGTSFIVHKALNIKSAKELDGADHLRVPGHTNEVDVSDYFRKNNSSLRPS